jgi:hypothetical protein
VLEPETHLREVGVLTGQDLAELLPLNLFRHRSTVRPPLLFGIAPADKT